MDHAHPPIPAQPGAEKAETAHHGLARDRDRFRLLLDVNNALATHLNLPDLLRAISACLRKVVGHDFAGVAMYYQAAKRNEKWKMA